MGEKAGIWTCCRANLAIKFNWLQNPKLDSRNVYKHTTRNTWSGAESTSFGDGSLLSFFPAIWTTLLAAAAAAKSLQSCLTLCDPTDGSPPGSPITGILQARTLEWVAISFSNVWKWKVKGKSLSRVRLFETPWTAAFRAPASMGFSRQEYWSGVPSPTSNTYFR